MDWKEVATGLLSMVSVVGGWFLAKLHGDCERLSAQVADLNTMIARDYVHKNDLHVLKSDFKEMLDGVFRKLDRIEDKLDQKADK